MHAADKLDLPADLTLIVLPPRAPDVNPAENIIGRGYQRPWN
ncbi:hypothetical protein [Mesorhizobium sp. WSM2239]|uniref:Transposase n=2 Tax=unclassified Mesorhizobium TaxID=325217 RepID=A0AAU8D932_9HYPH